MATLAHVSDLHFGRIDERLVAALSDDLRALAPDLVAVSGDLTQRARTAQFRAARAFLDGLGLPWLAVPGNHDLPLYDLARRLLSPRGRFREWISADGLPTWCGDGVAVCAIDTSDHLVWKDGQARARDVGRAAAFFAEHGAGRAGVLVAHHPFLLPPGLPDRLTVDGAAAALAALVPRGVSVVLGGHLHLAYLGDAAVPHRLPAGSVLAVQAGTATSTRLRARETNSYNVLRFEGDRLGVEVRAWSGAAYAQMREDRYRRAGSAWATE